MAPRTPNDAAMTAALALLRARGRSRVEIARALERRGYEPPVVEATLGRLQTLGYLDDDAFAKARAGTLLRGRLGPDAVRQKLTAHGLDEPAAEAAVAHAMEEQGFDPLTAAREVLCKRRLDPAGLDAKNRGRAARLLASRGFSEDVIERLLGTPD